MKYLKVSSMKPRTTLTNFIKTVKMNEMKSEIKQKKTMARRILLIHKVTRIRNQTEKDHGQEDPAHSQSEENKDNTQNENKQTQNDSSLQNTPNENEENQDNSNTQNTPNEMEGTQDDTSNKYYPVEKLVKAKLISGKKHFLVK